MFFLLRFHAYGVLVTRSFPTCMYSDNRIKEDLKLYAAVKSYY